MSGNLYALYRQQQLHAGAEEAVPYPCCCLCYPQVGGGGVGDLPLLCHSSLIRCQNTRETGVFAVGEGKEVGGKGGRGILACVTGGWYHGGERSGQLQGQRGPIYLIQAVLVEGSTMEKGGKKKFDSYLRVYQVAKAEAAS